MLLDAERLESWAKSPEARTVLPDLIRRLMLGAGARLRRLDLRGGSAADLPAFDGIVEAIEPTPWAPCGRSVWELSCEGDPAAKAARDLKKRTAQTSPEYRAETAFVFVTPRRWSGKGRWVESARDRRWKEVRAYDADRPRARSGLGTATYSVFPVTRPASFLRLAAPLAITRKILPLRDATYQFFGLHIGYVASKIGRL